MRECQINPGSVTSSTVGYTLAPRINAAGRMGRVELAAELFMTQDEEEAAQLASQLCRLNRQRQAIEAEIYADAVAMRGRKSRTQLFWQESTGIRALWVSWPPDCPRTMPARCF